MDINNLLDSFVHHCLVVCEPKVFVSKQSSTIEAEILQTHCEMIDLPGVLLISAIIGIAVGDDFYLRERSSRDGQEASGRVCNLLAYKHGCTKWIFLSGFSRISACFVTTMPSRPQ